MSLHTLRGHGASSRQPGRHQAVRAMWQTQSSALALMNARATTSTSHMKMLTAVCAIESLPASDDDRIVQISTAKPTKQSA